MSVSTQREAELQAQGWVRQTLINQPRLSEIVEEYRNLGFEVHLEPLDPGACPSSGKCSLCFENPKLAGQFRVVYTRPRRGNEKAEQGQDGDSRSRQKFRTSNS